EHPLPHFAPAVLNDGAWLNPRHDERRRFAVKLFTAYDWTLEDGILRQHYNRPIGFDRPPRDIPDHSAFGMGQLDPALLPTALGENFYPEVVGDGRTIVFGL